MVTWSWYAALPLRRRVSMSAIGSVMVIGGPSAFPPRFPARAHLRALRFRENTATRCLWIRRGDLRRRSDIAKAPGWDTSSRSFPRPARRSGKRGGADGLAFARAPIVTKRRAGDSHTQQG